MTSAETVFDLRDRVIWVTGSTRGIGRVIAGHLTNCGASVVIHGRDKERAAAVSADLERSFAVAGDARDAEQVERIVHAISDRFGRLDALVANVGAAYHGAAETVDANQWRKAMAVNLDATFLTASAAHPLVADARGSMVFISATAATSPTPNFAAYGAGKAAVEHLTKTLAAEWGPHVRVNCVSPGIVLTEGSAQALFGGDERKIDRAGTTTAVGRVGRPEDIAWAVHFLISQAASYISGHVLVVDGGLTEGPADRVMRAVSDQ